ncbi:hypothetical protein [Rhodoferax sp.]|uniref:hypothetical protein n=1 Tax=Rhodoferax sp. TaxID=50421 RepID=UPI002846A0E7|nr:hypothetical protein [Rhodoferax sp.]MDR3371258.1 hypothetical protein [Rhodoferax sp.]
MNTIHLTTMPKSLAGRTLILSLASATALLCVTGDALARGRNTIITGANGQTASRSVNRSEGNVSSSTTGPNGKTASRVVLRSATGTTSTMTGFNGNTATRSTTRTDTGSQTTVTGPNGQTGSVTVTHP